MTEPRNSKITLTYSSKWNDMSSRSGFLWGESIPEESLTMVLPEPEELTIYQLLKWYLKFLRHFGFNDKLIRMGLANHLFDEIVTDDELREIGKEYGFVTEYDVDAKVEEEAKKKVEAKEEWDRLKKTEGPMGTVEFINND
jgi:hypothetical protein